MERKELEVFKEWFDYIKDENGNDLPVFNRQAKVYFCQCSENGFMNLYELLKFCSDTATEDYTQRGLSWKVLDEHDYAILTSRQSFNITRLPEVDERILMTSWEETPEPLQLVRRYKITDESGKELVSGHSTWILVNPRTHRILRTADFSLRSPAPVYKVPFKGIPNGKISIPEELTALNQRPICYSDTDNNGHTNNARYGAFTYDCLPEKYQKKTFTNFRINYAKEAKKGQMLQMFANFDDAGKKITIVGKNGDTVCFESELYYA